MKCLPYPRYLCCIIVPNDPHPRVPETPLLVKHPRCSQDTKAQFFVHGLFTARAILWHVPLELKRQADGIWWTQWHCLRAEKNQGFRKAQGWFKTYRSIQHPATKQQSPGVTQADIAIIFRMDARSFSPHGSIFTLSFPDAVPLHFKGWRLRMPSRTRHPESPQSCESPLLRS